MMKIIRFLILFWTEASGFTSNLTLVRGSPKTKFSLTALYAANKNPLVIVGNTNEALGAAMAVCARDVILDGPDSTDRSSPIPPPQPIAFYSKHAPWQELEREKQQSMSFDTISSIQNAVLFLGPSLDDYEQILANSLQLFSRVDVYKDCKILHTSIEFGSEDGSQAMQSLSMNQSKFSFLGLNLNPCKQSNPEDGNFKMSREIAYDWGNKLQSLLVGRDRSSAAVSMEICAHLAMLQANSLPRCRGALGEKDKWAITDRIQGGMHVEHGDGMLFEYQFNYNDPFGGCDPLICPSVGYIVPSVPSICGADTQKGANDAYASAYSVMVGLGMDGLSSMCVATSVKSLFIELGRPPSYTWNNIDEIVKRGIKSFQSVRREDGLPRKMYKKFGYK
ncbi:hypothetical protein ACHAW6_001144 [Cyclotella cf. meneghiniana]